MRVLFDIGHPAHVHLFRYVIGKLRDRGDECAVAAREKDVALRLLEGHGIPYKVLAPVRRGMLGQLRELFARERALLSLGRQFKPDLIVGTSVNAARVAKYLRAKSVIVNEDDARAVPLFRWLAYPLATAIVTPQCLAFERYGRRHWTYPSYHELFYLHPNRFTPNGAIRGALGMSDGEPFAIIRLSALEAHHDKGERGIGEVIVLRVVEMVGSDMRVFISGEKSLTPTLEPYRFPIAPEHMHDALAFAEFFLGDSQTMTAEAAVLGTPAFRINTFVGRISYLHELEEFGLAFGFRPGDERDLVARLAEMLKATDRKAEFERKHHEMLEARIDPLDWFVRTLDRVRNGETSR